MSKNRNISNILDQNTVFSASITVGNDAVNVFANAVIIKTGSTEINATSILANTMHLVGGPAIYWGNGDPSLSAANGSIYLNTAGSNTTNRIFVNTDGSTGWTAIITVA